MTVLCQILQREKPPHRVREVTSPRSDAIFRPPRHRPHVYPRFDAGRLQRTVRPMPRYWTLVAFLSFLLMPRVLSAEMPIRDYDRVDIASTKTSIYIGSITMTMPVFERHDDTYSADYRAKVFPYFFYSEHGRLSITVPDEDLRKLERGEVIQFVGEGVSSDGEHRHIEGRAVPTDAKSGKIKVRVFVSKKIQLIFNTTYRFVAH